MKQLKEEDHDMEQDSSDTEARYHDNNNEEEEESMSSSDSYSDECSIEVGSFENYDDEDEEEW